VHSLRVTVFTGDSYPKLEEHSMTMIPIDMDQVPTSQSPLDESLTYRVILRGIDMSPKSDKNGDKYYKVKCEVVSGEYKGRPVGDPYIRKPIPRGELKQILGHEPSDSEMREASDKGVRFAQLVRCFAIPYTAQGIDVAHGVGREGNVTIKNEEYPLGSGELRSKINVYMAP
jgi:hypothetical protein